MTDESYNLASGSFSPNQHWTGRYTPERWNDIRPWSPTSHHCSAVQAHDEFIDENHGQVHRRSRLVPAASGGGRSTAGSGSRTSPCCSQACATARLDESSPASGALRWQDRVQNCSAATPAASWVWSLRWNCNAVKATFVKPWWRNGQLKPGGLGWTRIANPLSPWLIHIKHAVLSAVRNRQC